MLSSIATSPKRVLQESEKRRSMLGDALHRLCQAEVSLSAVRATLKSQKMECESLSQEISKLDQAIEQQAEISSQKLSCTSKLNSTFSESFSHYSDSATDIANFFNMLQSSVTHNMTILTVLQEKLSLSTSIHCGKLSNLLPKLHILSQSLEQTSTSDMEDEVRKVCDALQENERQTTDKPLLSFIGDETMSEAGVTSFPLLSAFSNQLLSDLSSSTTNFLETLQASPHHRAYDSLLSQFMNALSTKTPLSSNDQKRDIQAHSSQIADKMTKISELQKALEQIEQQASYNSGKKLLRQ